MHVLLLCVQVIPALIRIWPKTNSPKQVLFLSELEDVRPTAYLPSPRLLPPSIPFSFIPSYRMFGPSRNHGHVRFGWETRTLRRVGGGPMWAVDLVGRPHSLLYALRNSKATHGRLSMINLLGRAHAHAVKFDHLANSPFV